MYITIKSGVFNVDYSLLLEQLENLPTNNEEEREIKEARIKELENEIYYKNIEEL